MDVKKLRLYGRRRYEGLGLRGEGHTYKETREGNEGLGKRAPKKTVSRGTHFVF
jgi:hypothetical protein